MSEFGSSQRPYQSTSPESPIQTGLLAKLTIEVMDPNTGEVVAYGESNQDSLGAMGSTYREVIDRAVIQLLGRSE